MSDEKQETTFIGDNALTDPWSTLDEDLPSENTSPPDPVPQLSGTNPPGQEPLPQTQYGPPQTVPIPPPYTPGQLPVYGPQYMGYRSGAGLQEPENTSPPDPVPQLSSGTNPPGQEPLPQTQYGPPQTVPIPPPYTPGQPPVYGPQYMGYRSGAGLQEPPQPFYGQQTAIGQPVLSQPLIGQQVAFRQPVFQQPLIGQRPALPKQAFRDQPVNAVCPCCGLDIITGTKFDAGCLAWLLCFLLAIFGLWMGCCLIPFCSKCCLDVIHYCPNCRVTIHVYKRM